MNILIVVHANMALTDCWTYQPDKGKAYYNSILAVGNKYDIVLCPFLHPYYPDWADEHTKFLVDCEDAFGYAGFEFKIGEFIETYLTDILLDNEVAQIDFAGGYATDCLSSTLYRFLTDYGTYCEDNNINIGLRHDLIYDGCSQSLLNENKQPDTVKTMLENSGFYRFNIEPEHFNNGVML